MVEGCATEHVCRQLEVKVTVVENYLENPQIFQKRMLENYTCHWKTYRVVPLIYLLTCSIPNLLLDCTVHGKRHRYSVVEG